MVLQGAKFKIGQKIEVIDKSNLAYRSNIQDIVRDMLVVDIPMAEGKYFLMHQGLIIEYFVSTGNEVIKCRSTVLGKKAERNLQLAVLSPPEIIERVQRREYYRLPVTMSIKYSVLPEDSHIKFLGDVPDECLKNMSKSVTIDLSGGGAKIITNESVHRGNHIVLTLMIPEEVTMLCRVIRVEKDEINRNYKVALRYDGIPERVRDKIIKYIFTKLRNQSKVLK